MEKTEILPFSNGSQFLSWESKNCGKCPKYENESTKREDARCKYSYDLEFSAGSGSIPISTLDYFGFTKNNHLADCPFLHCNKSKNYIQYIYDKIKLEKEREERKKSEPELDF